MHRFFADPQKTDQQRLILTPEDTAHALKVLRMKPGDPAEVVFHETRYQAEMVSVSDGVAELRPLSVLPSTEPRLRITLFQGLPKSDKMDWIIQKSVELGVLRVVPVAFSRSVVQLNDQDGEKKQKRWQKIAREAGKQSGRCIIPEVSAPVSFGKLPALFSCCDCVAVPWEECPEGGPLAFVSRHPSLLSLGIVIGPEGGISPEEIQQLTACGCEPVTLGKRILRTETAGIAALSVFFGLYGEME